MDHRQICQAFFDEPLRNPRTGKVINQGAKIYNDLVKECGMNPISEYWGEFEYLTRVAPHLIPPGVKSYEPRGIFVYDPDYPAQGRMIPFEQALELLRQGRIVRYIISEQRQRKAVKEGSSFKYVPVDPTGQNTVVTLIDADKHRYHVLARYDPTTNQIYPPITH